MNTEGHNPNAACGERYYGYPRSTVTAGFISRKEPKSRLMSRPKKRRGKKRRRA